MKHIKLFEEFKIKPRAVDVPVYSTGQRPITSDNKKIIRKQDVIVATDATIKQIVRDEIARLGTNADLNHIDVSKVTDMTNLFYGTDFQGDVSQWDVSSVKDMRFMFQECTNFNSDISNWDVSTVKSMNSIFDRCFNFNCDISKWDVSKVENMNYMFYWCTSFNQDISSWDVRNVIYNDRMFSNCPIKEEYKPKYK